MKEYVIKSDELGVREWKTCARSPQEAAEKLAEVYDIDRPVIAAGQESPVVEVVGHGRFKVIGCFEPVYRAREVSDDS